jgi:hypothetical protein
MKVEAEVPEVMSLHKQVSTEYYEFLSIFKVQIADTLSLPCIFDYAIDLKPGKDLSW